MEICWLVFLIFLVLIIMGLGIYFSLRKRESFRQKFCFSISQETEPYAPPRIIKGFLSPSECDRIVKESDRLGFSNSLVADNQEDLKSRTSKTCWIYHNNTPLIQKIYKRVRKIPEIQQMGDKAILEDCQVVKYEKDQEYKAHYDQCYEKEKFCKDQIKRFGGPRKWTLLMYLTDECKGGETVFPNLGLKIKPKKGDAVLFHSLTNDNRQVHPYSFHQGSPVKSGEKRIANVWVRVLQK